MKGAELKAGRISAERSKLAARVITVLQKSSARRARRLMPIESSDGASSGISSTRLSTAALKKLVTKNTSRSRLETKLEAQIWAASPMHWKSMEREVRFHPRRMWRFDLAWPSSKLAIEIEGGIFVQGGHTRGAGYRANCEKYNEAILLGWRVLRVTDRDIDNGKAITWIERALLEGYA